MAIKRNKKSLVSVAKEGILDYINSNKLKPGDKLASENELSKILGISRTTLREALAELSREKIIYKKHGKGTFVMEEPSFLKSGLEKFEGVTEVIRSFNYEPKTDLLKVLIHVPDEEVRKKLELPENEMVVTYYRKRYANDKFAVYSISSSPVSLFGENIPKCFENESMINYFENVLKIKITAAKAEIIPYIFDKTTEKLLDIEPGTLFLLLKQVVIDSLGRKVIYSLDYYNSEVFKFFINRKR